MTIPKQMTEDGGISTIPQFFPVNGLPDDDHIQISHTEMQETMHMAIQVLKPNVAI